MRRILRTVSRRVPGGERVLRRLNRSRQLRMVRRSGIFDPEWYRRQVPQAPADRDGALRHYLGHGRRQGYAPSPLFDPAWFDPQGWDAKGLDPLVRYLIDGPGSYGPSPLFDERAWVKHFPDARHHPGRGLGHLLATATADTPLPTRVPGAELTFGAAVALLEEAEPVWTADHDRARRRVTRVWDAGAEREFRRRWQAVRPPSGGDGPLVSVITPVRNRATQVLTAIASVQAQTLTDWELLVVDDGSTDRTAQAVELVAAADRRIRLLRRPHGGVSAARNAGIAAARGRYIAFLDSDNQWTPHFLQLMTAAMDGTGTGAGYGALEIHDGLRVGYLAFEGDLADLEHGNHVDLNVLVVRRDLLLLAGGFDPALRRMVDYDLVVRLARLEPLRLFPFIGTIYDSREEAGPRISTSESARWDEAVKNHLFGGWDELRAGLADRVAGRVSVLLPVSGPASAALRAITHLQRHAGDADLEIVVLDNGGQRPAWTQLSAALAHRPGIRLTRFSRDVGPVLGANRALRESTGEYVVVVRPEVVVDGPWLQPLVDALADPAVGAAQPLVVDSAGLVCTAGGVPLPVPGRAEPLWVPGLQGLPVEDAAGLP
ncbi:MAG TPA: glycosyltransferase family 2 protein, partial [Kineosporiaceae bacterium]|nr:glycosyltransferase family 2 protein [Kineosporiaceae bacterium]